MYGFCPTRTKGQVEIALDCVDRAERIGYVPQGCGFPAATTAAVGLNPTSIQVSSWLVTVSLLRCSTQARRVSILQSLGQTEDDVASERKMKGVAEGEGAVEVERCKSGGRVVRTARRTWMRRD